MAPIALDAQETPSMTDDPFDLALTLVTEGGAGTLDIACGSGDGCGSSCSSACTSLL